MNSESKTTYIFAENEEMTVVSVEGIGFHSSGFDFRGKIMAGGCRSFSSLGSIKVENIVYIEWKTSDGELHEQKFEKPQSVPSIIKVESSLILYYYDDKWWMKYLPGEKFYHSYNLPPLIRSWHRLSE